MIEDPRLHFHAIRIKSVHDGDTFSEVDCDLDFNNWMLGRPLRLLGVAAPELGLVKAPIPEGHRVTELLMGLLGRDRFMDTRDRGFFGGYGNFEAIPGREPVAIIRTTLERGGTEKYGRILATVWLPGQAESINSQLNRLMT